MTKNENPDDTVAAKYGASAWVKSDTPRNMPPLIHTIVPAQPGYECIELAVTGVLVQRLPVVAWVITNSMVAVPITTDMNANVRYVRSPLGSVADQHNGRHWHNTDSFAEDMKSADEIGIPFTTRGLIGSVE